MLSVEKVDLRINLGILLRVFQRLENQQSYRQKEKRDVLKETTALM